MKAKILLIALLLIKTSLVMSQTDLIFKSGMEQGFEARVNDTGITRASNHPSTNGIVCANVNISSPQDCHQGRDATHNDDSDGHAGFSFTKLNASGTPLAASASEWSCVRDNVTGLIWEVKTDDGGLHDKDDRYSWYNNDPFTNNGHDGFADSNGDICFGYTISINSTFCNTQAYAARVNIQGLCGNNDWKVPDLNQLHSLANLGSNSPGTHTNFFPNTFSSYWSFSPDAAPFQIVLSSWVVQLGGSIYPEDKSLGRHMRLVRTEQ